MTDQPSPEEVRRVCDLFRRCGDLEPNDIAIIVQAADAEQATEAARKSAADHLRKAVAMGNMTDAIAKLWRDAINEVADDLEEGTL